MKLIDKLKQSLSKFDDGASLKEIKINLPKIKNITSFYKKIIIKLI